MKAKWVIEVGDLERENWEKIVDYLKETNREYVRIDYRPFTCEKPKTPFNDRDCVIVFGCLGLLRSIVQKTQWTPGVWCDFNTLKCSHYLSHWGKYSIHERYCFLPLAEVKRNYGDLFVIYNCSWDNKLLDHIFVRPDDNFKTFNGELVAREHWNDFIRNVECYEPAPDTLCMVSRPSRIAAEWRFVIGDGKVVTGSQYRLNRSAEIAEGFEDGAAAFAEKIASDGWTPNSFYCMDICKTEEGDYRLMEIGSVNGAGLYAMDIKKIVDKANEIAEREWKEIYEEN